METIIVTGGNGHFVASWRGFEAEGQTEREALWNLLYDYGEAIGLTLSTSELPTDFSLPVELSLARTPELDLAQPPPGMSMEGWDKIPWSTELLD
jgi:hypothetical protein